MTTAGTTATDQVTQHKELTSWVSTWVAHCEPNAVHWCDGSDDEYARLMKLMHDEGLAVHANEAKRTNCYIFRSDPSDVARVEDRTYIASRKKEDAGPTNNWIDPTELKSTLKGLFKGCMRGRTMYVIPYCMGPIGSPIAKIGVQLTDSPYVVVNTHIMARVGTKVLDALGDNGEFVPCLHSVGKPLAEGESDNGEWPCAPIEQKYIAHFPEDREIWSYGSGYGGNALLGKKCLALRIASVQARDEGWLAEHMLIVKITNPEGRSKYIAAAFPSACGKTNLAMLIPTLPGWKAETVGDDIAWMRFGSDGRLYAINPEAGFFGVAPGTSMKSNPNAMKTINQDAIFTNVAVTQDHDVWWEGIGYDPDGPVTDWKGRTRMLDEIDEPAAHPNSRYTARASRCPVMAPEWEDPHGVPISAILFGGRRPSTIPLVYQARDWNHGVFIGSSMGSEVTAAAIGLKAGTVRRDPFAMKPFCGYHMADYFAHWIALGKQADVSKLPKIFSVNWFRTDDRGRFLWPGFGENSRVIKWIFERCDNEGDAVDSPIGWLPGPTAITLDGIESEVSGETMRELLRVDADDWRQEIDQIGEYYKQFGDRLPPELTHQLEMLRKRLQ